LKRRQTSGQILILVLLVLLGLIVISVSLSRSSVRSSGLPAVDDAFWLVGGQRVSSAVVGGSVEAHVVIRATSEYVGSIVVKIRKDIAHWSDSDFQISTIPVNLKGGDEQETKLVFVPDEASNTRFFGLRGYFIEVDFQATRTSWVMENSYPPRLAVTT
jgi:hypothetical protein